MIDADANSVIERGRHHRRSGRAGSTDRASSPAPTNLDRPGHWGTRRFLKLIGAAAVLTVIVTLIAVAVHNSNDSGETPAPSTVAVTEPATDARVSRRRRRRHRRTTTTTSTSTTIVGTTTSGP